MHPCQTKFNEYSIDNIIDNGIEIIIKLKMVMVVVLIMVMIIMMIMIIIMMMIMMRVTTGLVEISAHLKTSYAC